MTRSLPEVTGPHANGHTFHPRHKLNMKGWWNSRFGIGRELQELGKGVESIAISEQERINIANRKAQRQNPALGPEPVPFRPPRFDPGDEMLAYLEEHGYVVVRNALREDEVEHAKDLMWEFLEKTSEMRRADVRTWESFPGSSLNGILYRDGVGSSDWLWFLRTRATVTQAFSFICGTDKLITSFDGGNIFRPYGRGYGDANWRTNGGWYHVDQGKEKLGKQAVQGLVTLFPTGADRGGLVVAPGSHRFHSTLMEQTTSKRDLVYVDPADEILAECPPVMLECEAGDLLLWDSRTIHCNAPALATPCDTGGDLLRAVGYVCMVARDRATKETLKERMEAYETHATSTHWPHDFRKGSTRDLPRRLLADAPAQVRELV